MSFACPWCNVDLEEEFVRSLGRIQEPCPHCAKPVRESYYQVMFAIALSLPLSAVILYLCQVVFELGSPIGTVLVMLSGIALWVYLYRFVPRVHGPSKGLLL